MGEKVPKTSHRIGNFPESPSFSNTEHDREIKAMPFESWTGENNNVHRYWKKNRDSVFKCIFSSVLDLQSQSLALACGNFMRKRKLRAPTVTVHFPSLEGRPLHTPGFPSFALHRASVWQMHCSSSFDSSTFHFSVLMELVTILTGKTIRQHQNEQKNSRLVTHWLHFKVLHLFDRFCCASQI